MRGATTTTIIISLCKMSEISNVATFMCLCKIVDYQRERERCYNPLTVFNDGLNHRTDKPPQMCALSFHCQYRPCCREPIE